MKRFQIIVEGDADKKFFEDYYHHIFGEKAPQHSINHTGDLKGDKTGGYKKLSDEINIREMRINSDQGGVNLVVFDADEDIEVRRQELETIKEQYHVEFDKPLFIAFDFNYVLVDYEPSIIESMLFGFKKEMMDMIGNQYANHISRIGITSFK